MQRVPIAIPAIQLSTSPAVCYTTPAATTTTLANLSFTNASANPVKVTLHNVPSGGAPTVNNVLVSAFSVSGGQTYVPPQTVGLNLAAASSLQAFADAASAVVVQGGAYETSGS